MEINFNWKSKSKNTLKWKINLDKKFKNLKVFFLFFEHKKILLFYR